MAWHRSNETSKRLDAIPGVGPALATALVASIANPRAFRSGRDFSAWIGLVPKQNSSGGKEKLGNITIRMLFDYLVTGGVLDRAIESSRPHSESVTMRFAREACANLEPAGPASIFNALLDIARDSRHHCSQYAWS